MRDVNGDGAIDTQTPVSHGYNIHPAFGGHGISGITLGPRLVVAKCATGQGPHSGGPAHSQPKAVILKQLPFRGERGRRSRVQNLDIEIGRPPTS